MSASQLLTVSVRLPSMRQILDYFFGLAVHLFLSGTFLGHQPQCAPSKSASPEHPRRRRHISGGIQVMAPFGGKSLVDAVSGIRGNGVGRVLAAVAAAMLVRLFCLFSGPGIAYYPRTTPTVISLRRKDQEEDGDLSPRKVRPVTIQWRNITCSLLLTVRETLSFAAELQLPEISSAEKRDEYVNNLLLFKLGLVRLFIDLCIFVYQNPEICFLIIHLWFSQKAAAAISFSIGNERPLRRSVFKQNNNIGFNSEPWSSSLALNQRITSIGDSKRYTNSRICMSVQQTRSSKVSVSPIELEDPKDPPLHLYKPKEACTAKIVSVERVIGANAPGETTCENGVCSNFLCDSKPGDKIQISGPSGKVMLLLEDDSNATHIMIATGTGVWPTRIVFLYDDEFSKYFKDQPENFKFDKALSREEKNKKGGKMYVQDKIEEYSGEIFKLLDNAAHIYLCGLKGMMHGIQDTLKRVAEERGESWDLKLSQLKKNKQWHVEVY
ncbi:unnamed protein product [Microthlaspi erraticum]|uniref:ferredoxin--NADP(+) reductase n=1 Tax=Microthlaspi erraticum TaxID=1685480 RepID=A0A6D2JLZ4_9BRAS|nr:unnamed protein product [Microthlaspi erraticum]